MPGKKTHSSNDGGDAGVSAYLPLSDLLFLTISRVVNAEPFCFFSPYMLMWRFLTHCAAFDWHPSPLSAAGWGCGEIFWHQFRFFTPGGAAVEYRVNRCYYVLFFWGGKWDFFHMASFQSFPRNFLHNVHPLYLIFQTCRARQFVQWCWNWCPCNQTQPPPKSDFNIRPWQRRDGYISQ